MTSTIKVLADLRFARDTGLGKVQQALLDRRPPWAEVVDLQVPGRYGHPLSPARIASSLRKVQSASPAIFWSCGFVPPLYSSVPVAVTVHDLTHLKYYDAARRAYFKGVLKPLYRRCDAIVCVSEYTRGELLAWSGVPAERVHVVYNGIDPSYAANRESASLGYRYVFYVGNHRSYKNLARLIRAYGHSKLREENVHLVLTGHREPDLGEVIGELGLGEYVHFIGHVAESELPKVYRGAVALAYVSLCEGFGLPILEAMASDTPVITSNVSSMPEVAAEAALIVDPFSVEAITGALDQVVLDQALREELVRRGRERVNVFQWDASARTFWDLMRAMTLPQKI
jgi:glycosyltransferase involved in cell wall biosynthesis